MSAIPPERKPSGRTGARIELARYSVSTGQRVLFVQRVDGVVRVTDVPLVPGGRAYLVERGLEEREPTPRRRSKRWSPTTCGMFAVLR